MIQKNKKVATQILSIWREKTYKKMVKRTEFFEIQH